jgi:hypothetical protein
MDTEGAAEQANAIAKVDITAILACVAFDGMKTVADLPGVRNVVVGPVVSAGGSCRLGSGGDDRLGE